MNVFTAFSLVIINDNLTYRSRSYVCKRCDKNFSKLASFNYYETPINTKEQNCSLSRKNLNEDIKLTLNFLNYLRWLSGFKNKISFDYSYLDSICKCAIYNHFNELTNYPVGEGHECYSYEVLQGCQSSLVQKGVTNTASAILNSYRNENDEYLGQRMWLLYHKFGYTTFCGAGNATAFKVVGNKEVEIENLTFIVSPPPGPCPKEFFLNTWSFIAPGLSGQAEVVVYVNGTKVNMKSEPEVLGWNFFTYKFIKFVPDTVYAPSTTYEVTVIDGETQYDYSIFTTDCNSDISDQEFNEQKYYDSRINDLKKDLSNTGILVGSSAAFLVLVIIILIGVLVSFDKKNSIINAYTKPQNEKHQNQQRMRRNSDERQTNNNKAKAPNNQGARSRNQTVKAK
ncbi:hypothetical protein TVAG_195790 [Trichomonas vaginalis G3]|uniref:Uncharacterized protein n=1 Tax=Trichomonas vaginalis (strain ATCC PRA-98 / G3) TaxID=412133 RepID=A2ETL8_TRIV3|nr:hypothetical protein TVAGG3_0404000 [Trichomonas vaginalis G3]EAY03986.1 hypothetical protein TVAG_195790 [Trichomonas vaginalis G3]KAI5534900.1 hypothetical protein TVAGG3_0404000 [Trichomonas vaginalis G3]|eukprot:XP_001316209.1 hypothetical protein [Trichomonas vaginalis G3]